MKKTLSVLGVALGRRLPASGLVCRHDPLPRVIGFGRPRAAGRPQRRRPMGARPNRLGDEADRIGRARRRRFGRPNPDANADADANAAAGAVRQFEDDQAAEFEGGTFGSAWNRNETAPTLAPDTPCTSPGSALPSSTTLRPSTLIAME